MANFGQNYHSNLFEDVQNAYSMLPIPPNAHFDPSVADVSSAMYPQTDSWDLVDQPGDPFLFREMYLDQPPDFVNGTEWLNQTSPLNDPYTSQTYETTMAYNNVHPRDTNVPYLRYYEQPPYPFEENNNANLLRGSAPMAIHIPDQASPLPVQSWTSTGSRLSITPPNDSGSDGGSDDHHHPMGYRATESPSASSSGSSWLAPSPREETATVATGPIASVERNESASPTTQVNPPNAPPTSSYYRVRTPYSAPISASVRPHTVTPVSPTPLRSRQTVGSTANARYPKKRKACDSCFDRHLSCAVPANGSKCNQCLRKGIDCSFVPC
ncbi:hypothetical protein FRC19_002093 [Serendipita sp. 401]|nr:hypothetical protein FRC19_002093 [Serendipita sp. 401]